MLDRVQLHLVFVPGRNTHRAVDLVKAEAPIRCQRVALMEFLRELRHHADRALAKSDDQ